MRISFASLTAGRAASAWGDALARVVLAASAYMQSQTTLLTGLVIVAPGIGGALSRGRLDFLIRRLGFRKLAIAAESLRAILFLFAAWFRNWPLTIAALVIAGAMQPLFEGALSGLLATELSDESNRRSMNSLLRSGYLVGAFVGAALPAMTAVSVSSALLWDALSFVVSAVSFFGFSEPAFEKRETDLSATVQTTRNAGRVALIYCGLAVGLAIAAPSMPAISHRVFSSTGAGPLGAYGLYQVAILIGMIAGGWLWRRRRPREGGWLVVLSLGVSAPALIAFWPVVAVFSFWMIVSALCENVLVLEIQTRFQTLATPAEGARAAARLRTWLAAISAAGLAVNLVLSRFTSPLTLLALAGFCGAVLGISIFLWPAFPVSRTCQVEGG